MKLTANGLRLEVDVQGPPDGPPLLLIMGLGMQLIAWPEELVQQLVARGFRVLRFDNRDAGLSDGFDHLGTPNLVWAAARYGLRLPLSAPYGIADLAADALGVLDVLGIAQAHVCGASMGGMVAQHLAARHPARVRSLTLMMTTSGHRALPQPHWRVQRLLLTRPMPGGEAAVVRHLQRLMQTIGSPGYPEDPAQLQARLQTAVRRAWRPAGTARQLLAVAADGDRRALLPLIQAPTAIIHGQADPLIPVQAGLQLQALIRCAQADFIPGMGHDLPQALLPRFVQTLADNAARPLTAH